MDTPCYTEVLAHHEAGHAVVALRLGVRLLQMDLDDINGSVRDGLNCGELDPELMSQRDRQCARRKAVILLAGEMAEREFDPTMDTFASEHDRSELDALALLLYGNGPPAEKWKESAADEAEVMVVANWTKVCALARALVAARHLSGEEATCIVQAA